MSSSKAGEEDQTVNLSCFEDYPTWDRALHIYAKELGVQDFLEGKACLETVPPPVPDFDDPKYEKKKGLRHRKEHCIMSYVLSGADEPLGRVTKVFCSTDITERGAKDYQHDMGLYSLRAAEFMTKRTNLRELERWFIHTVSPGIFEACCSSSNSICKWYENVAFWYGGLKELPTKS